MPSAREYAKLIIAESKKPESERTFTIAHVPVKMRGEVGHLLRKEYGGNESDKRFGEAMKVVANTIPAASAAVIAAPAVTKFIVNPATKKFIVDSIVGWLGGKTADKLVEIDSKGKYAGVGDYVYEVSGLKSATEGSKLENVARFATELTNPGYYVSGLAKPVIKIGTEIGSRILPGPRTIKHRYTRQNIKQGVKDLLNYLDTDKSAEPNFFKTVRNEGEKYVISTTPIYVTNNGILIDFPSRPVYKNASNTAALTKLDDHTYSLRLSPKHGETLSLADRKQVLNWVNDLPRHSYVSGDYSTYPQGQVFTNMLKEGNFAAFVKNYIWPSKGVRLSTSGMSPDAYEYVAKLAKRPGYELRYMPEPMTSFNPLGAHGKNAQIYDGWVSTLSSSVSDKKKYIDSQLNPWLTDLGVEQLAYLDTKGDIVMPHIGVYKNELGGKIKMAE